MTLPDLLKDKSLKPKEKTETLNQWLLEGALPTDELLAFAEKAKDADKATCIEALEFATKQQPELADEAVFAFVTNTLTAKAPRIKWESAKVIANIAGRFQSNMEPAIANLLANTTHEGTVVRWSAATALGEILKLKTPHNQSLLPTLENICAKEEKNSIKKIYLDALKKACK